MKKILRPSDDDKKYEKTPRFSQDIIAYIIVLVGGLAAILYGFLG